MTVSSAREPIAIVGVGLRLPEAEELEAFWRHLAAGHALISEVPARRWDAAALKGDSATGNKTGSVWGGFVQDADCFDAPFFGISPREAAWMDPQQRFALETAWHAIEDAGYRAGALAGSRTGVYVGACHWDYAELLEKHLSHLDAYTPTGIAFSILANRISHFFDFQGPSITNDTACAASLTSVYQAVRALQAGECDLALAGGVNLIWSPNHFVSFSKAGMLSKEGRAKAFDDDADGYVRGEGGVMLLLKPLARALADGDPVHAVIRGVGVNHGGRTNSLTVTNPDAQAALIEGVHREAEVAPDSIGYVEAHGTGTPLGDPIEVAGLKQAFAARYAAAGTTPRPESCGIGSVKTNIGHLEGAAGAAGIVKVVAALRHGVLPPNVGFESLNRLIDLDGTPFRIQTAATPWPRTAGRPRRAGVSSFGFGGSNAHLVLEEAPEENRPAPSGGPVLLPLSARDDERLSIYAQALLDFLAADAGATRLVDIAYTMQIGREPMAARAAVVAEDERTLVEALQAFVRGDDHAALYRRGTEPEPVDTLSDTAARWISGEAVEWDVLNAGDASLRRVHLPLYPFARQRYWMDEAFGGKDPAGHFHPLLHRNVSDHDGLRHRTLLKGNEFFWADHRVGEAQVLPGVAYLEMARAAVEQAGATPFAAGLTFEGLAWTRPLQAGEESVAVELRLDREADGRLGFAIEAVTTTGRAGVAEGAILLGQAASPARRDIAALRAVASDEVPVADCYARLRDSGVHHGPAFQALTRVQRGDGQVVAQLKLPQRLRQTLGLLPLHPILLDAAIQAWVGLDSTPIGGAAVPFACRRIEVHGPCEAGMWVLVRPTAGARNDGTVRHLDIDLCDKDGGLRVAFRDLALRIVAPADLAVASVDVPVRRPDDASGLVLSRGQWEACPAPVSAAAAATRECQVLLAGLPAAVAERLSRACGIPVASLAAPDSETPAATAERWFADLHGRLAELMRRKPRLPQRLLVIVPAGLPSQLTAPLAALLKTAVVENPKVGGAVVRIDGEAAAERVAAVLAEEARAADGFAEVRYGADGRRDVWRPRPLAEQGADTAIELDPEGAYWITGGLGGVGLALADWLVEQGARHLVLTGRRAEPGGPEAEVRLQRLRTGGAAVHYVSCDMADAGDVARCAARIADEVGPLKGVIHAAGLLGDGYILTQQAAAFAPVFASKAAGAANLDAATQDAALDFMLLCSSVASVFGNAGQAAYAAANAFLDGFAEDRAARVARGERRGRTLSIAWPYWADGGMTADAPTLQALERRFGTRPLPTAVAVQALARLLAREEEGRCLVQYGAPARIAEVLESYGRGAPVEEQPEEPAAEVRQGPADAELEAHAVELIRETLAEALQMEPAQIQPNRKLDEYGLDSIVIVETTNRLEEVLGPLSKTLFFEYVDVAGVAGHLVEEHRDALAALSQPQKPARAAAAASAPSHAVASELPPGTEPVAPASHRQADDRHDIAVVGLSLRVAKASNQKDFWELLSKGLHGFEPYPRDRWNHDALLHPERDVLGKSVVRTGAFLDDVDKFDPRYFHISQAEAEVMSPEVRLFLEASVEAFEDAGYSREYLQARYGGDVAVLVGSMTNEYDLFGFQNMLVRGSLASGSYTGTVPNMVSYFYGFTGPSYFLDTMCSASSTCVHEAVHMLRAGRCRMALAGGVNLLLHPQKLIATSQEHFTSKTADVIRGYGLGADGTIVGEGVGALVLKPLTDAERDGDHIYGIITGTGISNAGVRNGFTVPNPNQQAVAIESALHDAGVSARSISYVEGHGSGTALGDPVEIKALTKVFRKDTDEVQYCPIGTVKSNVAHLLAASGLAGIVKVLMQLSHGQMAPSLHAETLNPDIPFERTPFRVQHELASWDRPRDERGAELPRRAGVTSIGAGGMNSHIVIEEYRGERARAPSTGPELLVFSAIGEATLRASIERFLAHLGEHPELDPADVAYTLQVGKNELPCRLALVVPDLETAAERLSAFLAAPARTDGLHYTRSVLDHTPSVTVDAVDGHVVNRDLDRIAAAWAEGSVVDWDRLHAGRRPRRVSLPAYPFERVRCWYPEAPDAPSVIHPLGARLKLHPLVGSNRSDLGTMRYVTPIHLGELLDYVFTRERKQALLPTAVVEVALAVARIAGLDGPLTLTGVAVEAEPDWTQAEELVCRLDRAPGDGCDGRLHIVLETNSDAGIGGRWAEAQVAADGAATTGAVEDIPALRAGARQVLDRAAVRSALQRRGLNFAPYLGVVEQAYLLPDGGILCDLVPDPPQQDGFKRRLQLPPPALGAAFQALVLALPEDADPALSRIDEVVATEGVVTQVLLRRGTEAGCFDLRFLAEDGAPVARFGGLRLAGAGSLATESPVVDEVARPSLSEELRTIAAEILKFPAGDLGLREPFHDLGFDSISLTRFAGEIGAAYGVDLSPAIFFECEHIDALSAHLGARHGVTPTAGGKRAAAAAAASPAPAVSAPSPSVAMPADDAVAIVGMAGRFPGSADVESFFDHLLAGRDLVTDLQLARYGAAYAERVGAAGFVKRGGFLEDVDRFDAAFFNISPTEACRMDPQQRLILETAWRALEDAGYRPDELPQDTGVFVGVSGLDYAELLRAHAVVSDGYVATGNSLAMVANRVSHVLNVRGPSQAIDTACSSSLVALLRACDALTGGRCGAALVGGVNLCLALDGFEGPHGAGMLSPEGRCKTFAADADGYVRGEGVAALLLKRLGDAKRDGDRVLGVVAGGAENHGGRAGSLTAPSAKAQAALVEHAMRGIDPRTISYIEAHGTGTNIGDPVEINGLKRAYAALMGDEPAIEPFIGLGAVKSSIGHLEAAAGLAGVVKVLTAMRRGELPPTLHCEEVNPQIELAGTPFRLIRQRESWGRPSDGLPRRAAVSSFGFGGANAHVILEDFLPVEPPRRAPLPPQRFAATRYWLPNIAPADASAAAPHSDRPMVLVPAWEEAPRRPPERAPAGRRIVFPCEIAVAATDDAEVRQLPAPADSDIGTRYHTLARELLALLRETLSAADRDRVLVQLAVPLGDERELFAGLGAMLETATAEDPRLVGQVIEVSCDLGPEASARLLAEEAGHDNRVRHLGGRRLVRKWRDLSATTAAHRWRERGVTLITGGLGGLGRLVAEDVARTAPGAVLVLAGASPLDAARTRFLEELRALGAVAYYRQVDVADGGAVAGLVRQTIEVHGRLDAVVHCAGVLRDGYVATKTDDDLAAVLAPKVTGALALRQACAGLELDAFVMFSSLAGAAGNAGQAGYAAANGFLDALAERGPETMVSVNWPLWRDGGMRVDAATQEALFRSMGQRPLPSDAGLAALHGVLASGTRRAAVVAGDDARIRAFFEDGERVARPAGAAAPAPAAASAAPEPQLLALVSHGLRRLFARISGLEAARIAEATPLEDYGIDSLMITRLNVELDDVFDALPKTLFFRYRTLADVSRYLVEQQPEACRRWVGAGAAPEPQATPVTPTGRPLSVTPEARPATSGAEPVAVIGLSGRYPGAADVEAFWESLFGGRDMVGEVPAERWDLDGFYHPDPDEAVARGMSYSKWGAFLEGFADFDPGFFKISPRDAAAMDPQERLFLMSAWEACEDAGYTRARLRTVAGGAEGADVGVFVGITKTGYALHGPFTTDDGATVRPTTSFAAIANRVSYVLDLAGPSMPVDTMCSSSLTAVHEAVEALRAGTCRMALAGGVNLYLHPANYLELSAARMLSAGGRCRSFGAGADGFVPGEGVGCLLLKPLSQALADGDRIHALIRGSAVNHGGRTNGYTVPNPAAQRDVIRGALAQAGSTADAVSYVEAHGTGTELGDPIEVAGLTEVFQADAVADGACALGSVKSMIGHLEAAAGLAGLTKVILQMRHRTLAPTLHAENLNPNIDLAGTPFRLQRAASPWNPEGARIAGVSSFGAGGANAHVIVEEWPTPSFAAEPDHANAAPGGAQAVVLSARDPDRLREQAARLLAFAETRRAGHGASTDVAAELRDKLAELLAVALADLDPAEPFDAFGLDPAQRAALARWIEERFGLDLDPVAFAHLSSLDQVAAHLHPMLPTDADAMPDLRDVAYTLQVGREAMACRLALEADSLSTLATGLRAWLDGTDGHPGVYGGEWRDRGEALESLLDDDVVPDVVAHWWAEGRLDRILKLWTAGADIDWLSLPRADRPDIVSLPTYPFARQRFWLPSARRDEVAERIAAPAGDAAPLQAEVEALEARLAPVLQGVLCEVPEAEVIAELRPWWTAAKRLLGEPETNPDSSAAWAGWERFGRERGRSAQMMLAEMTLCALPEILRGRRKATEVMFPEGALRLVEGVYKENAVAARFNRTLAAAAAAFVRRRLAETPRKGLRVLEIGAGTGSASEAVFDALGEMLGGIETYCYTDVSRAFLIHAERSYASRVPALTTALFDVEKPLAAQGLEAGGYDLAIAANVLHATADMRRTVATVREALAPGGLLLVNETSMPTLFTHVTFGLLEGWWRAIDSDVRIPGTPSLTAETWRRLLEDAGLRWIAASSAAERALGQQVVAAAVPEDAEAVAAVSRNARQPVPPASRRMAEPPRPRCELRDLLLAELGETLNVSPAEIAVEQSFADVGLDSILGSELVYRLRRALDIDIEQTRLFDFTTVVQLEAFIAAEYPEAVATLSAGPAPAPVAAPAATARPAVPATPAPGHEPIAIVGASGRFARSETIDDLWQHLMAGRDLVEPVTRFDLAPFYRDAEPGSYGRHGSFLDDVARFDPVFFGISGLEATYMDPQQRLFLEEAWRTLENAGHAGEDMVGRRCGVFVGCSHGDYQELFAGEPPGQAFWGNTSSLVPARISYWLDLKGPAVAVDTACSSSLVALHMACQSIRNGECEMALAGGVFAQCGPRFFRYANRAGLLSPSGRCAAFGAGADGIVPGEAVAAVLLRPLSEALADGDTIHGVIVGSGINQDGTTNGITAPSAASQERLIREVYEAFDIAPATVGLVEAHGTGTPLGDPIEHAALVRAFGDGVRPPCLLGSIKSNIGHATTAAGIAGLVKALWCLKHREIPPTLHFAGGNPAISFESGPFRVNDAPEAWPAVDGTPRRAAVSSFGFSGTNAHVVVEEAPDVAPEPDDAPAHLFVLSSRSRDQLRQQAERLAAHLAAHPALAPADVAFTLLAGRRHFHHRLAVVACDLATLTACLERWLGGEDDSGVGVAELEALDPREDFGRRAEGDALIAEMASSSPVDTVPWTESLQRLAGYYMAGSRLHFERLFRPGRRRVPLPTYPFTRSRYWVGQAAPAAPAEAEAAPAAEETAPAPKVRLASPSDAAGFHRPPPAASPRVALAAASAPAVRAASTSRLARAAARDGVRRLDLVGAWNGDLARRLAEELRAAAADDDLRAVVVVAADGWRGDGGAADEFAAPFDCPLPVVVAMGGSSAGAGLATALHADFLVVADDASLDGDASPLPERSASVASRRFGAATARALADDGTALSAAELRAGGGLQIVPAEDLANAATNLARQLADAPREALVELKAHMRRDPPAVDDAGACFVKALADAASDGDAVSNGARRLALSMGAMELELFDDGVILLRMRDRDSRNSFTPAFMDGIEEAFDAVAAEPDAKVVVLVGDDGYFACGGTREGLTELQDGAARFTDRRIYDLPLACELPVIAAMQGHAIGAGWSLGMFCDSAVFAAEKVYHSNYLWYGFTPGAGATLIFPRRLGDDLGREVLFTAREYKGSELARRDPRLTVLPSTQVLPAALALAHRLATHSRERLVDAKACEARPLAAQLDDVLARELAMHERTFIGNPRVRARIEEKFGVPAASGDGPATTAKASGSGRSQVRRTVAESLAEDLMIAVTDVRDSASFLDLGLDSILAVTWIRRLNQALGTELPATAVYAHPTVGGFVDHLASLVPEAVEETSPPPAETSSASPETHEQPPPARSAAAPAASGGEDDAGAIAIIGASGRFPKAADLEAFWDNIRAGRDCIEEVPADRWDVARYYDPRPEQPGTSYSKWMGALADLDRFDARFFDITPREAELMDPQQRLFLEDAWHAIEDAACDPLSLAGSRCGVYVAAGSSGYADLIDERNAYSLSGSSGSILAARISYVLDLRGPCLSVDTACSSSLVAIAEACNSLLLGDSDLALAGGVSALVGPSMFIDTSKVGMLSPDGRCYSFDERANGFVPGEGVGVALLKRLADAVRDGDPIRAVIRGWGINQDGRTNGITAPNPQAQTQLMRGIHARFGIDPASIGLVEAHGTGTALGDPIEVEGLRDAFRDSGAPAGSRALGSVKSNVGHLLAAAGVAGALKAMLALEARELPPTINFERQNGHIDLRETPFAINTQLRPWVAPEGAARRAAVSSFGFSGTNAHLVFEEYVPAQAATSVAGPWIFTLSARSRERLQDYVAVIADFVSARPALDLAALASTLQRGRAAMPVRLAFVFRDREDLQRALATVADGRPEPGVVLSEGDPDAVSFFETDDNTRGLIGKWLRSGTPEKLTKLAELWAKGLGIDWSAAPAAARIRLPGYPFARDRHWVSAETTASVTPADTVAERHPLLDGDGRTGEVARVSLAIEGDEPFLTTHAGSEHRLLLGLCLPEMARAAIERATARPLRGLKHLVWGAPLAINGHAPALEVIVMADAEGLLYRVVADGRQNAPCHLGAVLGETDDVYAPERADAAVFGAGDDVAAAFEAFAAGLAVCSGPAAPEAATVRETRRDGDTLLARLTRPAQGAVRDAAWQAVALDPLYLDAVWRLAAFRHSGWGRLGEQPALPFPHTLDAITADGPLPDELYVRIWNRTTAGDGDGGPATVVLYDAQGGVRMVLDRLVLVGAEQCGTISLGGECVP